MKTTLKIGPPQISLPPSPKKYKLTFFFMTTVTDLDSHTKTDFKPEIELFMKNITFMELPMHAHAEKKDILMQRHYAKHYIYMREGKGLVH